MRGRRRGKKRKRQYAVIKQERRDDMWTGIKGRQKERDRYFVRADCSL